MVTELEYAALSAFVYNDQRGGGPSGTENKLDVPPGWSRLETRGFVTGSRLVGSNTFSFTAGAFINAAGEVVIAFKGTDFLTEWGRQHHLVSDLLADIGLAFAGSVGLYQLLASSTYFLEVVRWAAKENIDPAKISFTGHSLGGGLASIMAVWFDRPAVNFAEAPFEQTAMDPLTVALAAQALALQAVATGSGAVAGELGRLINLLVPLEYQRRQSAIVNYHNRGEVAPIPPRNPAGGDGAGSPDRRWRRSVLSISCSFSALHKPSHRVAGR